MVFAGALGNAVMIALARKTQRLGASTMVFGLLGILSAVRTWHSWRRRQGGRGQLLRIVPWLPLLAGLAMLGIYGTAPAATCSDTAAASVPAWLSARCCLSVDRR
jgi:membrane associated rhomboid family serine protease